MDTIGDKTNPGNTANPAQEAEPSRLRDRGRVLNFKDRVIVYDCGKMRLQVRSRKEVDQDPNKGDYTEIRLPRRERELTIFVDQETESKVTTEQTTGGQSNVMLAKLYLDRLGIWNQILRCSGKLSTLYVSNI